MHWDKSQPAAEVRSRPYQGVRVRDPVKELLQRKRSAAASKSPTGAGPVSSHAGVLSSEASAALGEGCSGWRALPWSGPESSLQEPPAQGQSSSSGPAHSPAPDLYMQTLCPSYTMLTYTHTPLITNFGTIPVASVPGPLPQVDADSGLTYLPWTTVSSPAALTGSSLVHVPLSMSLATMIPQLDVQPLQPGTEGQAEDKQAPSLLDKLLEEHNKDKQEEKDSYSNSIFVPNV